MLRMTDTATKINNMSMLSTKKSMSTEKFCLKWNDFQSNISESFKELRDDPDFCDVTLVSEGKQQINAHKIILASSSSLFGDMLRSNKHNHPLIYMRGVQFKNLKAVLDFIYHGVANIYQEDLDGFLALAEELQLKGLTGGGHTEEGNPGEIKDKGPKVEDKLRNNHTKPKLLPNTVNHKMGRSLENISGHMVFAEPTEKYEIAEVNNFDNLTEKIESLIEKIHGIWTCKMCGKTSKSNLKGDMKRHAEIHIEGITHHCNVCGKIFRSSSLLRVHKYQKHTTSK